MCNVAAAACALVLWHEHLAHAPWVPPAMAAASTPPSKHRELSPPQAPLGKIGTGLVLVDKLAILAINGDTLADIRGRSRVLVFRFFLPSGSHPWEYLGL